MVRYVRLIVSLHGLKEDSVAEVIKKVREALEDTFEIDYESDLSVIADEDVEEEEE